MHTSVTTHFISVPMSAGQTSPVTPSFVKGNFPVSEISEIYTKRHVKDTMDSLIGENNRKKYFKDQISFIAKGHLAPNADFVYFSQRKATYKYLNCNPQFQGFNQFNWFALEKNIRSYNQSTILLIQSGVSYVLTLPKSEKKSVPLFLRANQNQIPIPMFFWKLVTGYHRKYLFFGINHPNVDLGRPLLEKYLAILSDICPPDYCDDPLYSWLNSDLRGYSGRINRNNQTRGILRCCIPDLVTLNSLGIKIPDNSPPWSWLSLISLFLLLFGIFVGFCTSRFL